MWTLQRLQIPNIPINEYIMYLQHDAESLILEELDSIVSDAYAPETTILEYMTLVHFTKGCVGFTKNNIKIMYNAT